MITARNVSKSYAEGTKALKSLDVKISQGEFVAIIGRSGAGKTTFLKLLNGTLDLSSGELEVLGSKYLKSQRRKIGFIFQQFNLVKNLTVLENVLMGRLGYHSDISGALGLYNSEDNKTALQYIKEVGLEGRENSRIDQLSGGQQQRVAIARALVQDPQIILADEPMASLDPKSSEMILDLLKHFNKTKDITVIVNIHVLELAKKYADRILAFKQGELVFDGVPSSLSEATLKKIYE